MTSIPDPRQGTFIPITTLAVGDYLPSWNGRVTAIRDTAKRRYITVSDPEGSETTDHQSKATNIFAVQGEKETPTMDPDAALVRLRELSEALVADPTNVENVTEFRRTFDGLDAWLVTRGFLPRHWERDARVKVAKQPRQAVKARTLRVKATNVREGDFVFAQHVSGSEIDDDFTFGKASPFSNPLSGLTAMFDAEGVRRAVVGNDDQIRIERAY